MSVVYAYCVQYTSCAGSLCTVHQLCRFTAYSTPVVQVYCVQYNSCAGSLCIVHQLCRFTVYSTIVVQVHCVQYYSCAGSLCTVHQLCRFNIPDIREFYGSTEGTYGTINIRNKEVLDYLSVPDWGVEANLLLSF